MTKAAKTYPTSIAKSTTPDESQDLKKNPERRVVHKCHLTRSEIYETLYPDKLTGKLSICGPSDSFMSFSSDGKISLVTGKKSKERGPASGELSVTSFGMKVRSEERAAFEFSAGEADEGEALNIMCYGDVTEDAKGSQRTIKAKKIMIQATEELHLLAGTQVFIQAGNIGGGTITMNASNVEKVTNNDKEIIFGQRQTFGVKEDTTTAFDPRSNVSIVSPGHINHKVLGDVKQYVGGVVQSVIAGAPLSIPLVKDRSASYSLTTTALGYRVVSAGLGTITATGPMTLAGSTFTGTFGAAQLTTAATNVTTAALTIQPASMVVTSPGNITLTGAIIYLN